MISGVIFQFKKGAFEDGPGVRTTVFLKGCPLRCLWCINPEGQNPYPELKVIRSRCTGCGKCADVCPKGCIKIEKTSIKKIYIDRNECTNCGDCVKVCYAGALDMYGKRMSVDQVIKEIKKDIPFYEHSGGGVTFGGGEPTFQPDFICELLVRCKELGIHTALDTCGYTINRKAAEALESADLLLFDIKNFRSEDHLRNTSVPNDVILKNLSRMAALEKPVVIRVPVIPGYTDSFQNIRSIAEFLKPMRSIVRIDLLPYMKYGIVKYDYLDREYKLKEVEPPTNEYMEEIKRLVERVLPSVKVNIGGVA